ncbi:photosystem II core complex proteins psbY, chloroplastic [Malania oleifera]|uniref:photosystem II core complex proteins psbY, chloroplastic n=1 Tax=Malania oleifera TaxID=397392 RepID=UPI0025ADF08B|nr:photosystem II core complex proteins psbY, chloroplastic [Malania oleifera]
MAATMATMAVLNARCLTMNPNSPKTKPPAKPISLVSLQNLPDGLRASPRPSDNHNPVLPTSLVAGALFSALSSCDSALAAQQIAEIADGDNRGIALLLPIIPAIAWVLFNILQPALNQINKMRSTKGVIVGLGLGGLAASGLVSPLNAAAGEIAAVADAAGDNRGQLLLFVVTPAILWVLYNILQPALNQINRMRSQ